MHEIGKKYLVTTDNWFYAPDGQTYRAVWGTVKGVKSDNETLGIKTNARATNWYLEIGNTIIAGCQIHYAIQTDEVNLVNSASEQYHEGVVVFNEVSSRIYNADGGL